MQAAHDQARDTVSKPPTPKRRLRLPKISEIAVVMSLLGLAGLSFLAGAASMYYRAPIARPLSDAFIGADAWRAGPMPLAGGMPEGRTEVRLFKEKPGLTSGGYTLWNTNEGAEAILYDMKLGVAHRWKMPEGIEWPAADGGAASANSLTFTCCHPYANGNLLVMCGAPAAPYGLGLAKLDRNSKLLWQLAGAFHHDLDVAEDGRIHALMRKQKDRLPAGIDSLAEPYADDILAIISPDGEILDEIPLVEAFLGTSYLATLLSCELTAPQGDTAPASTNQITGLLRRMQKGMPAADQDRAVARAGSMDVLHANGVRVLSKAMAGKFPLFKAGHVLLSMRTPSLIAVLDPAKRAIVWAARGPWRYQHDAQFLDTGRILLYDNAGSSRGARVLEYDPATQAIPWAFPGSMGEVMNAPTQGRCQRLPNGNTLAVEPKRRIVEVTPGGEIVWEVGFSENKDGRRVISTATRYRANDLPFLGGSAHGAKPHGKP